MVNHKKLLKLLEEKGYSQSYVSLKMGMSRGYLRDCVKKNIDIPKERLVLICEMLNTTPSYLCDEDDDRLEATWRAMNMARSKYHYLLNCYVQLVTEKLDDKKKAKKLCDMAHEMTTKQMFEFEDYINKLIKRG